ncbi:MAG: hypothetical protein AAGJ37_14880 [Pseudomonadota bacterium]
MLKLKKPNWLQHLQFLSVPQIRLSGKPRSTFNKRKIALLKKHYFNANCIVEYGSGGSTILSLEHSVNKIYSVETDPNWVDFVSDYPLCKESIATGRLVLEHFDIGKIRGHGRPKTKSHIHSWSRYASDIWKRIREDEMTNEVEGVLIDGRFRVAAALYSLLQAPDATLYFDDFTNRKESYGIVLQHLDVIDEADNLVALKRKANCKFPEVVENLCNYILQVR